MLILSRKIKESLIINGNIEVKVLGIQGSYVKLGVAAPKEISVDRQEVFESKQLNFKENSLLEKDLSQNTLSQNSLSQDNIFENNTKISEFNLLSKNQGEIL